MICPMMLTWRKRVDLNCLKYQLPHYLPHYYFSHFEIDVNDLRTDLELSLNITFKATILDNNRLIFIIVLHKHTMSGYRYDLNQTFNGKGSFQLNCYEMIRLDV